MASSFLISASKRVTAVRSFLREAAGGNSIKYMAEKGCRHIIYVPYQMNQIIDENGNTTQRKDLIAISGNVHEWQGMDGKYKATVCLKDVVRKAEDGTVLNDGSCPFCSRVGDAWDIFRYRKELEEANCNLTGDDRKKYMENLNKTLSDERKAKDAKTYMYILIVKFRQNANGEPVMGTDGLPEYDLKVMKLSQSRVDKIQQQIANAGSELPGSELAFEYPNTDDRRLQVSQSTTAPVFPNSMLIVKYPKLLDKINEDVSKFEWEGIEKSFPEWAGMTSAEATKIIDNLFEKWDAYNREKLVNPGATYMEYVVETAVTTPKLGGATVPDAPVMPGTPSGMSAPVLPDMNTVFSAQEIKI